MKKIILALAMFLFTIAGCGTSGSTDGDADTAEVSKIINKHLDVSPYLPETDYKLGSVVIEYHMVNLEEPIKAIVNYYDDSEELTKTDDESMESFKENFPERKVVYGSLYIEPPVVSIEIYPDGLEMNDEEIEIIEISGHDVQYIYYSEEEEGRDSDIIIMLIEFDEFSYWVLYQVQSENIEEEAKSLAEEIIKNNN